MIEGLMFKFREACIYTWVNVNLNLSERIFNVFPKIHVFLLTENVYTCSLHININSATVSFYNYRFNLQVL